MISELDITFDGFDIYFYPYRDNLPKFTRQISDILEERPHAVLHTDFFTYDWRKEVDYGEFREDLQAIRNMAEDAMIKNIVIHADLLVREPERILDMLQEELTGLRISLEVTDKTTDYGNTPDQLVKLLKLNEDLGLVLDTAHVQDFADEYGWEAYFKDNLLNSRMYMTHMSNHSCHLESNFYDSNGFTGIDATHSFCISKKENFPVELIELCREKPMVIEGVVPPGNNGLELLREEMKWLMG
jgi:hypothetical protein